MATEAPDSAPGQEVDADLTMLDVALTLAENVRLLVVGSLAAGLVALGLSFLISPIYTATARLIPPGQQQSSSSALLAAQLAPIAGLMGGVGGFRTPADQYVSLLKSRTVYDAIVEQFNLMELYNVSFKQDARKVLASSSRIAAGAKDGIISIEVEDTDPKRAANIANAFVTELRSMTKRLAVTEAAQRRLFFETQLQLARDNLTKAEIALRASGVSEAVLKTVPQSALEALARLKAQIAAQEIKLSSMRTFMTDSNPEYRLALNELFALRAEQQKAEQNTAGSESGQGAEYVAKFRDFKYHETLFELMAKQFEIARLDEAREGLVIQVVESAQPPERKTRPKKAEIAVTTTLFAFVLLVLYVIARKRLGSLSLNGQTVEKMSRLKQVLKFGWRGHSTGKH